MSTSSAYVVEAAEWADKMTNIESRGHGDRENAWERLERRYHLPPNTFWKLKYRRPRDIFTGVYFQLCAAYEAERARQMRLFRNEQKNARKIAGPRHLAVRAAGALVGDAAPARRLPTDVP